MDANIALLRRNRQNVLDEILKVVKDWDKTYEMGIEIVDKIAEPLKELGSINNSLRSKLGFVPFDKPYEKCILSLEKEYGIIIERLEVERKKLLELIKETKLKEKVRDNYILKDRDSIFIDKDL